MCYFWQVITKGSTIFMATTQTFETIIRLNSQEAKNNLELLKKKVDDLKAARDKAIQSKADSSFVKDLNKDLKAARAELRSYETNVSNTVKTIEDLSSSSVKDVKKDMRALKQEMEKTTDPEDYVKLQARWEECKQRVDEFSHAVELSETRVKSLENVMNNLKTASLSKLSGKPKGTFLLGKSQTEQPDRFSGLDEPAG